MSLGYHDCSGFRSSVVPKLNNRNWWRTTFLVASLFYFPENRRKVSEIITESAKTNSNLGVVVKLLDNENLTRAVRLFLPLRREKRARAIKMLAR